MRSSGRIFFKPWHSNFLYCPHYHYPRLTFSRRLSFLSSLFPSAPIDRVTKPPNLPEPNFQMESPRTKPPPLVGWRSKATGIVHRNACTQAGLATDKFTNTERDVGVQAYLFPDIHDKIVTSNPCRKADLDDVRNEKTLESVVKIQRFYRWDGEVSR